MSEDITMVFLHFRKCRDVALNGVICLEKNIADLDGKFVLTDGEHVTLDYVANKLQMFEAEFHEHHYKLLDCVDALGELKAQQRIFNDHERKMIDSFTRITNVWSCEKTVTPPTKSSRGDGFSFKVYHRSLCLLTSQAKLIDDNSKDIYLR